MNILLGVTGGIAAYKACSLVSRLKRREHQVHVIMTENAKKFVTPLTFSSLSGNPVIHDMWQERTGTITHIDYAQKADLFICYPATANILAKFIHGIADDMLSTIFLALPSDTLKILCPAMNTMMWYNQSVQKNIREFTAMERRWRIRICGPIEGSLACGDKGVGKVASVEEVIEVVELEAYLKGRTTNP